MKKSMQAQIYIALFSTALSISAMAADVQKCSELSTQQKADIGSKKEVIGPSGAVYLRLPGTAKEAMALFADFRSHSDIFPNVKQAVVVAKTGKLSWDVKYTVDAYVKDVQYTVQDDLQTNENQTSFRMDWKGKSLPEVVKQINGAVSFENVNGFVCMTYLNQFALNVGGSGLLGNIAERATAKANVEGARAFLAAMTKASSSSAAKDALAEKVINLDEKLNAAANSAPAQAQPAKAVKAAAK